MNKIPVCFITGFLGSGKTTFIEKLVEKFAGKNILYLVNEFSPKDVDGQRLALKEDELVKIPGGSIFCKCLAGQFIKVLSDIGGMDLDGVVIEASGIANPKVANDMFIETKLDQVFSITSIIAVVDPRSFLKLCRTLPNIKEQVAAATDIIINKIDLFASDKIEETENAVLEINNTAVLTRASFCEVDVDVFAQNSEITVSGEYTECKDPNFCQVVMQVDGNEKWELLQRKLALLGDDLYRVKGSIRLPEQGLIRVDFDGARWYSEEDRSAVAEHAGEVVVIASGFKEEMLKAIKELIA